MLHSEVRCIARRVPGKILLYGIIMKVWNFWS